MKPPVAFFIFKRPETTQKVFDAIRQAKPSHLFVIADGPRLDRIGEAELCVAARRIIDQVDWDCEVIKNYSEANLGCKKRIASGLDWVFSIVEEAIILEDDCLPHSTFFDFCEILLEKYRQDERIFLISGQNVQMGRRANDFDYYFSRYTHCWGWATWKRAWSHYDLNMTNWPYVRDHKILNSILADDKYALKVWNKVFESVYNQEIDTWDYQFLFSVWIQGGLTILPNVKLTENIGYGPDGTHTTGKNPYAHIPLESVETPLKHPPVIVRDQRADYFSQRTLYDYQSSYLRRFLRKLKKYIN